MTVLQKQTAGGVSSQRGRKFLVAGVMAVVGLGIAFGLSQVIGSSPVTVTGDNQARIEAGAAYGTALEQAAELRNRAEAGAAYGAALEAARQANVWTLEDELAAIHQSRHAIPVKPFENVWTLEDELAAIHQSRHNLNTVRGSVGSQAIAEHSNSLGWELEQIRGGGTTDSDTETVVLQRYGSLNVE